MGTIISAAVQGVVSALLAPLLTWFRNRQLIKQGQAQQVAADQAQDLKGVQGALKAATDTTSASTRDSLRDGTF